MNLTSNRTTGMILMLGSLYIALSINVFAWRYYLQAQNTLLQSILLISALLIQIAGAYYGYPMSKVRSSKHQDQASQWFSFLCFAFGLLALGAVVVNYLPIISALLYLPQIVMIGASVTRGEQR